MGRKQREKAREKLGEPKTKTEVVGCGKESETERTTQTGNERGRTNI